jgi:hypothetical protein
VNWQLVNAVVPQLKTMHQFRELEGWISLFVQRIQGRERMGLRRLMQKEKAKIEENHLSQSEVLSLYQYTGPLYMLMNAILRSSPPHILDLLRGKKTKDRNTLSTTIFCAVSGLKKLARNTEMPQDCKVYRGLGSMSLPETFWVEHDKPAWRGGVEKAFMSTTMDKDVALVYSKGRGTVVEIEVGRIQIGGTMIWLSMVFPCILSLLIFIIDHYLYLHHAVQPILFKCKGCS